MIPSFSDAQKVWWRIGLLSFGGPAGQIALIHHEVIEKRKWISEQEFLHALNFCMLLPGPEAMQLATYVGWKLHGIKGGMTAGLLFVLPGAITILVLSMLYATLGQISFIAGFFWGIKSAILAIVLQALLRIAKKALKDRVDWLIAAFSFVALFCFAIPFPVIVGFSAIVGFLLPLQKQVPTIAKIEFPNWQTTFKTVVIWLSIWLVPLGAIYQIYGNAHVFSGLAQFFSQLAVVTFGGAYAVLSYMGQDVVEMRGWLTTPEMIDGLGLAETTPGPLILVGQFVGFIAAAKVQSNLWAGLFGSIIFLWMTFVPCFLWIFAGAPYVVHLQNNPRLAAALQRITAAVVGVILNLSLWFGLHIFFAQVSRFKSLVPLWWPELTSFDLPAFLLSIIAGIALLQFKIGVPKTLALCAVLGIMTKLI
jgi:chromate transporter